MSQLLEDRQEVQVDSKPSHSVSSADEIQGLFPERRSVGIAYSLQLLRVGAPLWFFDLMAIGLSLSIALLTVTQIGKEVNHFYLFLGCCLGAYSLCFWAAGIYPGVGVHPARELKQLFRGSLTASLAITLGLLIASNAGSPYVWMVGIGFLLQCLLIPFGRSAAKAFMRRFGLGVPFYFVGSHREVSRVFADMSRFGWTMLSPIGRFCESGADTGENLFLHGLEKKVPYMGTIEDLSERSSRDPVYWLFVTSDVNHDAPK